MRKSILGLLLIALAAPASADPEPRPISLSEAVSLARKNAPSTIRAQGDERTSAAAVRSAYAAFLPSLSLSAGATRQLPGGERTRIENGQVITIPSEPWSYSAGLAANLVVFDGGRRFFDLRQARAEAAGAAVTSTVEDFAVALAAKQQYFNVLAARESQVAAQAQLEQAEQQRRVSVARTRARVATRSDSLRAEIQVRNAQLAMADARNALDLANASLTRVVGAPDPVTAEASEAPGQTAAESRIAVAEPRLLELAAGAPAIRQAQSALTAAQAAKRGSWTDYLPTLNLGYSRSGSGASQDFTLASDLSYAGSLRFSLSLPLFDRLQREAQVTRAQVAETNAEAVLRDARLAAREDLVRWLGSYRVADERIGALTATIDAAQEDLRVQQQRYAAGSSTLLDVLTSQTQLDQARRDLIRAHYDQRLAKAQLEALVGRDL